MQSECLSLNNVEDLGDMTQLPTEIISNSHRVAVDIWMMIQRQNLAGSTCATAAAEPRHSRSGNARYSWPTKGQLLQSIQDIDIS